MANKIKRSKGVALVCRRCGEVVDGSPSASKKVLVVCPVCKAIEEKDLNQGSNIN